MPYALLNGMPIALVPAYLHMIGSALLIVAHIPPTFINRSPLPQAFLYPSLFLVALVAITAYANK